MTKRNQHVEVIKGVSGQKIYFQLEGRPSATPTVEIKDENGNTITAAASTNVTQNTVNTTVSSAGSVGDKSLTLASVTGIEFRKTYLVTNSALQKEWVRVLGVNSSTKAVTLDEKLEFAHDTSATFVSTEFYYTLQSGDVDTLEEMWRARASATVGGETVIDEVRFDVVLTPIHSPLTVEFVKKRRPDIMRQEHDSTLGTDYADLREAAWDNILSAIRVHCAGMHEEGRPALIRTPEDLDSWALAELDALLSDNKVDILGWDDRQAESEELKNRRNAARQHTLSSIRWMDFDQGDSRQDDEVQPRRADLVR